MIREFTESNAARTLSGRDTDALEAVFLANPMPVVVWTAHGGKLRDVNDRFAEMIGFPRDVLVGRSVVEIGLFADAAAGARVMETLAEGRTVRNYHGRFRRRWGDEVTALLSASVADIDGVPHVIAVFAEVSDRLQVEGTLRASAELQLRRETTFVLLLQDVATAANKARTAGEALRASLGTMCQLAGWDLGRAYTLEHQGPQLLSTDIWYPEGGDRFEAFRSATRELDPTADDGISAAVLRSERPVWLTDLWTNGRFARGRAARQCGLSTAFAFPILIADYPVAVCELFAMDVRAPDRKFEDIAGHIGAVLGRVFEREYAQRAITTARDRFATLFHSSPVPLGITDLESGRFWEVNNRFIDIFGFPREAVLGRTAVELGLWVNSDGREALMERVTRERFVPDYELLMRTRTGDIRSILTTLQVITLDGIPSILASLVDVTQRKHVEINLRKSREEQGRLARRLLEIQEEERTRIARELHDEVGQALAAVKLSVSALRSGKSGSASRMEDTLATIDIAIQQVRSMSFGLRPSALDDLGLPAALRVYAKDQAARSGIALELDVKPIDIDLPPPVETACFRIAQEAVTNVLQHAQSTTLMVQLVHHEHQLRLVVEDTGRGFDVEALITRSNTASQLGVLGMRERAQLAGGEVRIESAEGRGTRVVATFSLAATGGAE